MYLMICPPLQQSDASVPLSSVASYRTAFQRLPDKPSSDRTGRTAWLRGEGRDSTLSVSCYLGFRYLKQIQDLPPTGLPQMNLLEMYSLKDEMGNLRWGQTGQGRGRGRGGGWTEEHRRCGV